MESDKIIDLLILQETLKEGIEDIMPRKQWVRAEIASVQVKANGHCYMDLCHNENGKTLAKAKAVIWRSHYIPLMTYFKEATGGVLESGMEILVRVQVNYSELYGLSLVVDSIEPGFTLGAAELQRRETIAKLEADGLLRKQKQLVPSAIPYRLAVISAKDAAGYGDFCRQIDENEYGFKFELTLFEATMQGLTAPESICDALCLIEASGKPYDAVLIMRGGGSALDLACFDDYGLCFTIANCGIPVYTAIGHDRDHHVADMVAYDNLKTPTALAAMFIDSLAAEDERISSFSTRLRMAFVARIAAMESEVSLLESRIRNADPRNVLARGYTLVTDGQGVVLKSGAQLRKGDLVRVIFSDGSHNAIIS